MYGATGQAITVLQNGVRVRLKGEDHEHEEQAAALKAPYDDPISYLIAVVGGQVKPSGLGALDTNVTVVRILDAARESARTGKTVKLR